MRANTYSFLLGVFFLIFAPTFFPPLFFAPYLVISIYTFPLFSCLVRSVFCGVLIDLASAHPYFGLTPLVLSLTTLVIYTQKTNFFEDKLSTLPLLTFLFSSLFSLLEMCMFALFGGSVSLSMRWIMTDVFVMALFDALFAFIFISLPFFLSKVLFKIFKKKIRRWFDL